MGPLFSKRLPHVVTRADFATMLTPTYAAATRVDEAEAHDRLTQALAAGRLQDQLIQGLSEALRDWKGPRTSEDALIDRLSQSVQDRRAKVRAADATPAISAVLVSIDLEAGIAPEMMRRTLDTDKGRAILASGLKALGTHLLKELLK